MSDQIQGMFTRLTSIIKDHQGSITNLIIILLTIGSEEIFKVTVFVCPCHRRVMYGGLFIAAPAAFLFGLGILINNTSWRLVTGCCQIDRNICCRRTVGVTGGCRLMYVITQATLAPLVWIFVAFMDGKYFACARSTTKCDTENPSPILNDEEMAYSQIIGWIIIATATMLVVFFYCLNRCCDRFTFEQRQYATMYDEEEKLTFSTKAKISAQTDVEVNAEKFFEEKTMLSEPPLSDSSWQRLKSAWNSITVLGSRYEGRRGYTPLYYWSKFENTDTKSDSDDDAATPLTEVKTDDIELKSSEVNNA